MRNVLILVLTLFSVFANAQQLIDLDNVDVSPGLQSLLQRPNRPRLAELKQHRAEMAELIKLMEDADAKHREYYQGHYRHVAPIFGDAWAPEHIKENLPKLIISLEKAFPNGTYAFLGRDVNLWGDAMDAFYQSFGQTGRVQLLNASTASFSNAEPETLVNFLVQNGMDPRIVTVTDPEEYNSLKPFVIYDRTSMGSTSQSTKLMDAVFTMAARNGVPVHLLPEKFFVATTSGDVNPLYGDNSLEKLKTYGLQLELILSQALHDRKAALLQARLYGHQPPEPPPLKLTIYGQTMFNGRMTTNGVSTVRTDFPANDPTQQWHDPFQQFEEVDGKVIGRPGPAHHRSERMNVLYLMDQAEKQASSQEVFQSVFDGAIEHGVPSILNLVGKGKYLRVLEAKARVEVRQKRENQKQKEKAAFRRAKSNLLGYLQSNLEQVAENSKNAGITYHSQGYRMTEIGHALYQMYQQYQTVAHADEMVLTTARNLVKSGHLPSSDLVPLSQAILKTNPQAEVIRKRMRIGGLCTMVYR